MTDEREIQIKKDLLWDYQQTEIKLEAFKVQFGDAANSYMTLAELFRHDPGSFVPDISLMSSELQRLADMAKEYKELHLKNVELRDSLIKMKVI
jgi:hypothetical protein